MQNLDDFQRFMLRKTSMNEDESNGNEDISYTTKGNITMIYLKMKNVPFSNRSFYSKCLSK